MELIPPRTLKIQHMLEESHILIQNSKMVWSEKFSYITQDLMVKSYYERTLDNLRKLVKPDYVCADVGANIGYYTCMLAQLTTQPVYAFEPHPDNYAYLKKNIELNNYTNVILNNSAVTDYNGSTHLFVSDICTGMHRIYKSKYTTNESIRVRTIRLDDCVEKLDFIKIDVEGSELGVLRGMKRLLKNVKVMLMEFVPSGMIECGTEPHQILELLDDFKLSYEGDNLLGIKIT